MKTTKNSILGGGANTNFLSKSSDFLVDFDSNKFFKPLIASSLALVLSANIASADPSLKEDGTGSDKTSQAGLHWNIIQTNIIQPTFNNAQSTPIETLNFTFNNTNLSYTKNASALTITANKNLTIDADRKAFQLGAAGAGTLELNFGNTSNKVLTIQNLLAQEDTPTFKGNIRFLGGNGTLKLHLSDPSKTLLLNGNVYANYSNNSIYISIKK